jgi:DNA-binding Lrp family transcriptional regulator
MGSFMVLPFSRRALAISKFAFTNVKPITMRGGRNPHLKPDGTDTRILEALMQDGRASMREIARRTSLTTPTVSSRVARMMKAGLIKKFVPVLAPDAVERGVLALVTVRVASGVPERFAKDLAKFGEVEEVYTTTGQSVSFRVSLDSVQGLEAFLKRNVLGRTGVEVTSSEIVTGIVKEEPRSLLPGALTMNLECDYCHGEVSSSRPYTMVVGSSHYYFCCKPCKSEYLVRHGARLARLGAPVKA